MTNLDKHYMSEALKEARKAFEADEVPVGAVIVHKGRIIGRAHNQIKLLKDPTAHAEMIAITQAASCLGNERLLDTTLYATIEPCPMCAGAMVLGRVKRLVYGADDPKAGAAGSVCNIINNKRFNHRVASKKGVLKEECAALLKEFFAAKRKAARSLICIMVFICAMAAAAFGEKNHIEFRFVLSAEETVGKKTDTIQDGSGTLHVWQYPYLADIDIEKAEVFRSANKKNRLLIRFEFNENGRKKTYHLAGKSGDRMLAVFADGKLIATTSTLPPVFCRDRAIVVWPGSEAELRRVATEVNKKPPSVMGLYIEEQGRYNDVAAEAWAETYIRFVDYFEMKRRQFDSAKSLVEEMQE